MALNLKTDRAFLEKTIDPQTGKSFAQLLREDTKKVRVKRPRIRRPKIVYPFIPTDRVMRFTLAYPLSVNHMYVEFEGKRLLTKEGKAWKRTAAIEAVRQGAFLMTGEIALTFYLYRPQLSGDMHNRIKITEDALKNVAWYDDNQVAESHGYRRLDRKNPRIELEIRQIGPMPVR